MVIVCLAGDFMLRPQPTAQRATGRDGAIFPARDQNDKTFQLVTGFSEKSFQQPWGCFFFMLIFTPFAGELCHDAQ